MESEVLDEKIEWEARRVAAAFGFEHSVRLDPKHLFYVAPAMNIHMMWLHHDQDCQLEKLWLGQVTFSEDGTEKYEQNRLIECSYYGRHWMLNSNPEYTRDTDEHLARGLYCLGIEDETLLAALNCPLTAHEQLELRLSMPREFWPQKWRDEIRGE